MLNFIGYAGPISIEWEDAGMDRLRRGAGGPRLHPRAERHHAPEAAFDAAFASKE